MTGATPLRRLVRRYDTHRLIPSRYSEPMAGCWPALRTTTGTSPTFSNWTTGPTTGSSPRAICCPGSAWASWCLAFPITALSTPRSCHPHPLGSRFNGPDRGAWYAAFEIETAQTEIAFHKTLQLAEIGRFDDEVGVDDYLADFSGEFHDLRARGTSPRSSIPKAMSNPRHWPKRLVEAGALGVVYPSVRRGRRNLVSPASAPRWS